MKFCSRCKQDVPTAGFNKCSASRDGLQVWCRSCEAAYGRARDKANPEERSLSRRLRTARHKAKRSAWLRAAKTVPCADCGVEYPYYVMDFDHRPDENKVDSVSRLSLRASEAALAEEVAKCDIVCSNCHRERTHQRRSTTQMEDL